MKTTIIGLGLIGGSLTKDLRKLKFATELIGVDANVKHAKQALQVNPNNGGVLISQGSLYYRLEENDLAKESLKRAITILKKEGQMNGVRDAEALLNTIP